MSGQTKVKEFLLQTKKSIDDDERYHYPTATVDINAPLALIQCSMEAQMDLIDKCLDLIDG